MNLVQFLKTVDTFTKEMSRHELEVFIHNTARILPEEKRTGFLDRMKSIGEIEQSDVICTESEKQTVISIEEELLKAKQKLMQIEEGACCLIGELNEEYDDWYNSDADEFLFEDPENVLEVIKISIDLIHQCVDRELYKEGYELAAILSVLSIQVEGDYSDYAGDALDLWELEDCDLLTDDVFKKLVQDSLYLAYKGNKLEKRPEAIYSMMHNLRCHDARLEQVMQNGREELEQFDEFLDIWIEYLSTGEERDIKGLLLEAQMLLNDSGKMLENARKYVKQHPALFEQYLEQNLSAGNDLKMFDIGQEALHMIPHQYKIRSRIALLTSQYALQVQRTEEAERAWLEAFRSETNPVHYMRICLESRDYVNYKQEVTDIYNAVYKKTRQEGNCLHESGELIENRLGNNGYCTLLFLSGEFHKAIEQGMNVKEPLGWSSTFMKQGLALFMLFLFDGEELPAGLRENCKLAAEKLSFTPGEYCKGLNKTVDSDCTDFFWECFRRWKEKVSMSKEEQEVVVKELEHWIEVRVEGIMQANRRNYYYECAAFVAALGEVKESRGEKAGKERFMWAYRDKYSRRRAFHQELQKFGLRKK